jgi:hypothetical protein
MPCPSHPFWLDHSNYTCRRVQVMKLHIMQFSPASPIPFTISHIVCTQPCSLHNRTMSFRMPSEFSYVSRFAKVRRCLPVVSIFSW